MQGTLKKSCIPQRRTKTRERDVLPPIRNSNNVKMNNQHRKKLSQTLTESYIQKFNDKSQRPLIQKEVENFLKREKVTGKDLKELENRLEKKIDSQIINIFQLGIQRLQIILRLGDHPVINLISGELKRIQKNSRHNQHNNDISHCKTDQLFHKNRMHSKTFLHIYSPFFKKDLRSVFAFSKASSDMLRSILLPVWNPANSCTKFLRCFSSTIP